MDWWLVWTEIKPIVGPVIQAFVVVAVGIFTIKFQKRQANTAERKLFTDIHDKRYRALTSFTHDVTEAVLDALYTDDITNLPLSASKLQQRRREMSARIQELEWLFGSDLMNEVSRFYGHADNILNTVNRLRHHLKQDQDDTILVDQLNVDNRLMYEALAAVASKARYYLYVGDIKSFARDFEEDANVVHLQGTLQADALNS